MRDVFTRHVSRRLAPYCDGQLGAAEARAVEAHLARCARCRAACDEIRLAASRVRRLPLVAPPALVWNGIAAQLHAAPPHRFGVSIVRAAFAGLVVAATAGVAAYFTAWPMARPWVVAHLDDGGASQRMAEGDWVETDAASRARITVGAIGTVDVEPDTRVRLGTQSPDEHRLTLARGTISAQITAPPRVFFVDTPASTVVDLGCAYTVQVDESGTGDLRVTEGWASLEWQGRESLVPAGAHCQIRKDVGPGTPYFEDASPALRQALERIDFAEGGAEALATVLAEARVRDTLTLWHVLSRVPEAERARVYERIAELTPVPDGVSRERALQLDPETLERWRDELAWTW